MKHLRFGLYGCGARTDALLDSVFGDKLVSVSSCYDLDRTQSERAAKKYNARAVKTEQQLLEDPDVDAFLISLPPARHASAAIRAAEAGKPIFLEKPVATNLEDGRNLIKKLSGKDIICRVGLAYRYVPVFRKLAKLIEEGAFGTMLDVFYHWVSWAASVPIVINEGDNSNWRGSPESGGQLIYHCCHLFDLLRYFGSISGSGEVVSVFASTNHMIFPKSPSENVVVAAMEYESGAIAGFHHSEVSRQCDGFGRLEGSEATAEFSWNDNSVIKIFREARRTGERSADDVINISSPAIDDRAIMVDFIKEAAREQPVGVTVEDAFKALKIACAIRKSSKEGRKIQLDKDL